MSKKIELHILGQSLQLVCSEEQHEALTQAAQQLENQVNQLRDSTRILQLDKILTIIALNLIHELNQQKEQKKLADADFIERIAQLHTSLDEILEHSRKNSFKSHFANELMAKPIN